MIIDYILRILGADVASFLSTGVGLCRACISSGADRQSGNVYPPRIRIYDGFEALYRSVMEECEQMAAAREAAEREAAEMEAAEREAAEKEASIECPPEAPGVAEAPEAPEELVAMDCDDGSAEAPEPMDCVEHESAALESEPSEGVIEQDPSLDAQATEVWKTVQNFRNGCVPDGQWGGLRPLEKLPYYWAALTGDILSEVPFENFRLYYETTDPPAKKKGERRRRHGVKRSLEVWQCMDSKQRAPFVMEAFLALLAAGKVSLGEERQIQHAIHDLQC